MYLRYYESRTKSRIRFFFFASYNNSLPQEPTQQRSKQYKGDCYDCSPAASEMEKDLYRFGTLNIGSGNRSGGTELLF